MIISIENSIVSILETMVSEGTTIVNEIGIEVSDVPLVAVVYRETAIEPMTRSNDPRSPYNDHAGYALEHSYDLVLYTDRNYSTALSTLDVMVNEVYPLPWIMKRNNPDVGYSWKSFTGIDYEQIKEDSPRSVVMTMGVKEIRYEIRYKEV